MAEPIRQWCNTCQRATPSVIIDGQVYCAVHEPNGPDYGDDDE